MIHTRKMNVLLLSLSLASAAACVDSPAEDLATTALQPTPQQVTFAEKLDACDPAFRSELDAFVNGLSTLSPEPSSKCTGTQSLAEGCFSRWWNAVGLSERAACIAVGPVVCYTIICVV
jgi:hypothetical protein